MIRYVKKRIMSRLKGEVSTDYHIKQGLRVGKNFNRLGGCIIDYSHSWQISIGDDVTLAPRVHIIAHDASTKMHLGCTKLGLVSIGNKVFIGAGSIILPNVEIGNNVIIGSGSVVSKDIPDNSVAVGNPARVIGTTEEYIEKNRQLMKTRPVFDEPWTNTPEQKNKIIEQLKDGIGFIK